MKVALLGDAHGDLERLAACVAIAAARGAEAAIQLGDLGFCDALLGPGRNWPSFVIPVLALDGNHEDHDFLRKANSSGLSTAWATRGLCFQARGTTARLAGRNVTFLGGALHADRPQVRGIGNLISDVEVATTLAACATHPPDLIASHSCPAGIGIGVRGNPGMAMQVAQHVHAAGFDCGPAEDCGEPALRSLWDALPRRPAIWAFGHFHTTHRSQVGNTCFVAVPQVDASAQIAWDTASNTLVDLRDA